MTTAVDLAAPQPGMWAASQSAASLERSSHPQLASQLASWSGSVGLHGALVVGAALFLFVRPPPPAPVPVDAIIVEIVIEEPPPVVEEAGLEGAGAEQAPETPETAVPAPPTPQHLQVVVPNRALPEVLALQGPMSWEVEPSVQILLPSNIRTALATAYYCRSNALGIRAEQQDCPAILDQFALNARIAAMDPTMYYDAEFIEAAERLGLVGGGRSGAAAGAPGQAGARGPVNARDSRLSSADEMRDRLPPKHPAPFFGD